VVSTASRTASLARAFTYLPSGNTVLLRVDFADGVADGWTISPLGGAAGWSVVNGVYTYNGGGHTQSYRGDAWWSDRVGRGGSDLLAVLKRVQGKKPRQPPAEWMSAWEAYRIAVYEDPTGAGLGGQVVGAAVAADREFRGLERLRGTQAGPGQGGSKEQRESEEWLSGHTILRSWSLG